MKKVILASVTALFAMNASAATPITTTDNRAIVEMGDCVLLSEGVTLTLSQSVKASYACNENTNIIAISGCHPNGLKVGEGNTQNNYYTASTAGGVIKASQGAACGSESDATGTLADAAAGTVIDTPTDPDPVE